MTVAAWVPALASPLPLQGPQLRAILALPCPLGTDLPALVQHTRHTRVRPTRRKHCLLSEKYKASQLQPNCGQELWTPSKAVI